MLTPAPRVLRTWSDISARNGRRAAWWWLADRVADKAVRLHVDECVTLERDEVSLALPAPEGFEFRFLDADEVEALGADPVNLLTPRCVERIRAGHDLCFAAMHTESGRLAAYGWYALGSVEPEQCDGVAQSFPPDAAFMYKGYTNPEFRGLRLHGYVMGLALQRLAETHGITRLVSTVSWVNTASLKSCDRLGYRRRGRIVSLRRTALRAPRAGRALGVRYGRRADLGARMARR